MLKIRNKRERQGRNRARDKGDRVSENDNETTENGKRERDRNGVTEKERWMLRNRYLDFADFVSLELWSAVVVDESDTSCQLQTRNANELVVRESLMGLQGTTTNYI